jgi:osmotically-inducible protein OsmY
MRIGGFFSTKKRSKARAAVGSGAGRRAAARGRAAALARRTSAAARRRGRDLGERARRVLARLHGGRRRSYASTDDLVSERVQAAAGRLCSHPRALEIAVHDGCVQLRGPILDEEADRLLRGVLEIAGVREIEDDLDRQETGLGAAPGPT